MPPAIQLGFVLSRFLTKGCCAYLLEGYNVTFRYVLLMNSAAITTHWRKDSISQNMDEVLYFAVGFYLLMIAVTEYPMPRNCLHSSAKNDHLLLELMDHTQAPRYVPITDIYQRGLGLIKRMQ